jgi:hypothetical protein
MLDRPGMTVVIDSPKGAVADRIGRRLLPAITGLPRVVKYYPYVSTESDQRKISNKDDSQSMCSVSQVRGTVTAVARFPKICVMPVATELTARQARFVQEYLVDGRGAKAAIRAGYAVAGARVAAHRALTNAAVSSALQARQSADASRLSIQRNDVLEALVEAAQLARDQKQPMALIAAAREIGKLLGFYEADKLRMGVGTGEKAELDRLSSLSDADLLAIIDHGPAVLP